MNQAHESIDLTSTDADLSMGLPPEAGAIVVNQLEGFVADRLARDRLAVDGLPGVSLGDDVGGRDPIDGPPLEATNADSPDIVKRSIVVAGHKTSVSLEDAFWHALKDIARERRQSLRSLVAEIDAGRKGGNLSSAVRLNVLDHYRHRAGAALAVKG